MKTFSTLAAIILLNGAAAAQPVISSTSDSTLPRSGRLVIQGSGFGAVPGSSTVLIGGLPALFARWSDALITAYVPEAAATGQAAVQVITAGGASNAVPLSVTLRQPNGRVRWRFRADAPYIFQRPAIGPDGTIIAHDAGGFVYALTPDGGLKWIYKTRVFAGGPPSVGADGSVYLGDSTTVTALASDGALKWTFTHPDGRAIAAGPTVGPDGKIYAFFDVYNVYAFNPDGTVAWHFISTDLFDLFEWGAEMVFGPTLQGQQPSQVYLSFGASPTGFLWAWDMATGSLSFAHHQYSTWDSSMQPQGQAAVAKDGTIYTGAIVPIGGSSAINAFSPDGTLKWSNVAFGGISAPDIGPDSNIFFVYRAGRLAALNPAGTLLWDVFDGVNLLQYPIANPAGGMVFVGGGVNGASGFVRAYNSANGGIMWQIDLPSENGGNQWLGSRARFAADGQTVYFGTTIPTLAADNYCYLYAVDTTTSAAALADLTVSPSTVSGGTSSTGKVTLLAPAPPGGAVIALSSSNTAAATVPVSVTVPAGSTIATFSVKAKPVLAMTSVDISATYRGATKTAMLTITDSVAIQTAVYLRSRHQLRLAATSTSSSATLQVFDSSTNLLIGSLTNTGGGTYKGIFTLSSAPKSVTVKSSEGGSSTTKVTVLK